MEIICKNSKLCQFEKVCDHSKPHNIIHIKGRGSANNCILIERIVEISGRFKHSNCYCSPIFLRKNKLEKLNGL